MKEAASGHGSSVADSHAYLKSVLGSTTPLTDAWKRGSARISPAILVQFALTLAPYLLEEGTPSSLITPPQPQRWNEHRNGKERHWSQLTATASFATPLSLTSKCHCLTR